MLEKWLKRLRRKARIRSKIAGTASKPRLAVFRSNAYISAQLIDDDKGTTLVSASDLKKSNDISKTDSAKKVWTELAKKILDLKINTIVFDRGGAAYHGRVKALADSLREWGITF